MENRWLLIYDRYKNLQKTAINMLSGIISGYLSYVLPIKCIDELTEETIKNFNVLVVGKIRNNHLLLSLKQRGLIKVPNQSQGYSIYVGENPEQANRQIIAIAGFDDHGVLYGCMDFCNRYCGKLLYQTGNLYGRPFFENRFDGQLTSWQISTYPKIKTRAIWTWGHVIYDYRTFFRNMVRLRLNEIIIWNDVVPVNAKDIVQYAHSLGIKVIWGFAWGWDNNCTRVLENYNEDTAQEIKESVLKKYEKEYAAIGGDGIYFQSFTELDKECVAGRLIAQVVTDLVNDTASELLKRYPNLNIQFGLHSMSVKNRLNIIKSIDKRIHIVWEDCGAFPFNYNPNAIGNFEETLNFTSDILSLRGEEEKFGAVLKGMVNLDWATFEHFTDNYILGERTVQYLNERQIEKNKIWKLIQASWLKNAEYARKMISFIATNGKCPIVQGLVEDGMFENKIMFPVALFAELLWDANDNIGNMIEDVSKYPCVTFANV